MKRATLLTTAIAVFFCLGGFPLMAQGRGGAGAGMGSPGMGQQQGMGRRQGPVNGPTEGRGPGMENSRMGSANGPMMHRKTPEQLLAQNPKLVSKIQPLVPDGTNVQQAASGFKNLGQFVAALHVSQNLNIPFDQLKGKMVSGDSLGKAVHELNPNLSHKERKSAVKKAKKEAKHDIKASS